MRLTAGTRDAHRVPEPRRVHSLGVGDVSADERQTQYRLGVLLRPVADQLTVGDDAVALCPAEHAFVIETAGKLDVLQTRHPSAALQRLLLHARSTTSAAHKPWA